VTPLYAYLTRIGTFYISGANGKFYPVFEDQPLGCYRSIEEAVSDLSKGQTFSARDTNPGELGIPDDLGLWKRIGA
jgi:hypothetical protein